MRCPEHQTPHCKIRRTEHACPSLRDTPRIVSLHDKSRVSCAFLLLHSAECKRAGIWSGPNALRVASQATTGPGCACTAPPLWKTWASTQRFYPRAIHKHKFQRNSGFYGALGSGVDDVAHKFAASSQCHRRRALLTPMTFGPASSKHSDENDKADSIQALDKPMLLLFFSSDNTAF